MIYASAVTELSIGIRNSWESYVTWLSRKVGTRKTEQRGLLSNFICLFDPASTKLDAGSLANWLSLSLGRLLKDACLVLVRQSRMWTSQEKGSRGMEILSRKSDELLSVQMNISQAPLSFRQPVTQKKAFYPPFKVSIFCGQNHTWWIDRFKCQLALEMLDLPYRWRWMHTPSPKKGLCLSLNKYLTTASLLCLSILDYKTPVYTTLSRSF